MNAAAKQIEIGGLASDVEEAAEIEAGYLWRAELYSAMRSFVASYAAQGLRGYDACAAALDRRWGLDGINRGVSASTLRAALNDAERNHFRAEWLDWFARRSPEVAELMARRVKPMKTDAERLADVEAELRDVLAHKTVEQILRRARTR